MSGEQKNALFQEREDNDREALVQSTIAHQRIPRLLSFSCACIPMPAGEITVTEDGNLYRSVGPDFTSRPRVLVGKVLRVIAYLTWLGSLPAGITVGKFYLKKFGTNEPLGDLSPTGLPPSPSGGGGSHGHGGGGQPAGPGFQNMRFVNMDDGGVAGMSMCVITTCVGAGYLIYRIGNAVGGVQNVNILPVHDSAYRTATLMQQGQNVNTRPPQQNTDPRKSTNPFQQNADALTSTNPFSKEDGENNDNPF